MIEILIHSLELVLLALTAYLALTVYTLANRHKNNTLERGALSQRVTTYSRVESITSAQIFTGLQLLQAKQQGIDLLSMNEDWVDRNVSFYLMGAVKEISEHFECKREVRNDVMQYLLTTNLRLSESKAQSYISDIDFVEEETTEKSAMGAGTLAAQTWLTHKFIPEDQSLVNNLYSWGLIA